MTPEDEYGGLCRSFAAACRKADERQRKKPRDPKLEFLRRLMADTDSLERAQAAIYRRHFEGCASTVEALMLSLRERGAAALREPNTLRRLSELSTAQVREVIARLIKLRPRYPAIDDDLLLRLGDQL
jgi:hypothetical protein